MPGALVHRIADFHVGERFRKFLQETVRNLCVNDKALRSVTRLTPATYEASGGSHLNRFVEIGVIEHHEHIGATELEHRLLQILCRPR